MPFPGVRSGTKLFRVPGPHQPQRSALGGRNPRGSQAGEAPPTEYGGNAGLVEEYPHVPKAREILGMMMRDDDPADPASGVEVQDRFESAG